MRDRLWRIGRWPPSLRTVDSIAGLLDGPRAREAFLLRSLLDPPFSMRIQDEAPLTLVAMVRGSAWVLPDVGERQSMHAGDVAILRGPDPYVIADAPGTPVQVVILPGQVCTSPGGAELTGMQRMGVRTWGNTADSTGSITDGITDGITDTITDGITDTITDSTGAAGATVMLTGTYQLRSETSQRLLDALPSVLVLRAQSWSSPLIPYLAEEITKDEPGQEAVLDRLLDLLLIAVLRAWFARPEAQAPGWYRAHGDPVVGPALRLLHHNPAHPWTVASLARETGVSRAALARRFTELVGEPPMAFLTGWRLTIAADLLREPGATVGSVARKVGYASPFALSTAFKRVRGISPRQHRATATD
jgi:AraC-like DNA-binding protein